MRIIVSLTAFIFLSGCGQMAWQKPNAQQGEFEKARYVCLQQSQQYQSGVGMITPNVVTGGYTVIDGGGVSTNSQLFNYCMEASGWRLEKQKKEVSNLPKTSGNYSPSTNLPSPKGKSVYNRQDAETACTSATVKGSDAFNKCVEELVKTSR
jgi:hypothetical protein